MLNIKANIPAFYLPLIYMITSSTYSILCSKHKKLFSIWCYILRCWASKLLVAKRKWIICQSIMDIGTRPKFSTTHTPPQSFVCSSDWCFAQCMIVCLIKTHSTIIDSKTGRQNAPMGMNQKKKKLLILCTFVSITHCYIV